MPSLPFSFEDLRNLDIPKQAAEAKVESIDAPQINPQEFLGNAVDKVKQQFGTSEGLIDSGMTLNPVLRYTDMASKFFGGPGVAQGFKDGITQPVGDERSGQSEIRLPPMPF